MTILATRCCRPKSQEKPVAWAVESRRRRPRRRHRDAALLPQLATDDLRTLILNAIVWTAKRDVPKDGVQVNLPDLTTFKPASVEPVQRKK